MPSARDNEADAYKSVRALDRGLLVLDALAEHGWLSPAEIYRYTGVDRGTIYRLLHTLERRGYVVRRPQEARYFLSPKIRRLSLAIDDDDTHVMLVSAPLRRLVERVKWPSDFAMLAGGRLSIVDSTHRFTTLSFYRSVIGLSRPVMRSSLGRAILGGMSEAERENAIEEILRADGPDAAEVREPRAVQAVVDAFSRRGYALSVGESTPDVSAIALPVRASGHVVGSINIMVFRSIFKLDVAEAEYLPELRRCVAEVEAAFEQAGTQASPAA